MAVIGAAGGLGKGILAVCRDEGIGFTAIVRARPERITDVPPGSRVAVVTSLANRSALKSAFAGADAVLTAIGVTTTSQDGSALLSANLNTVEQAMSDAGADRIVVINTLLTSIPGKPASLLMRFFSRMPGTIGRGGREQRAVAGALGRGAFSSLRWTLVRGGLNSRGKDELPVASADWTGASNTWMPVSYRAMGRWMLEEAAAGEPKRYAAQEGGPMLTGSCHCGAVRVQVPRRPRRLTSCNCSICRRHAGLWGYYDRNKVKIVARRGAVDRYSWGDKYLWLYRCANCGCVTHWHPISRAMSRMGVNFRNFDPSVIESTRIRRFDGAKTWKFLD